MTEDDRGYVLVVEETALLAAEDAVAQAPAGGDRDRGQLYPPGHVPDRVDPGNVGHLELVGADVALRIQGNPGTLQTDAVHDCVTADRELHRIEGPEVPPAGHLQLERTVGLFGQGAGSGVHGNLDALIAQALE